MGVAPTTFDLYSASNSLPRQHLTGITIKPIGYTSDYELIIARAVVAAITALYQSKANPFM